MDSENPPKNLGIRQNQLITFMLDKKWIYRDPRNGRLHAYGPTCERGYMRNAPDLHTDADDNEVVHFRPVITPLGHARLAALLNAGKLL